MQIIMWSLLYAWLWIVLLVLLAGACGYSFRSELSRLARFLNRIDRLALHRRF